MNLAAVAQELNVGVEWGKVTLDFDELPKAAQRLWLFLWKATEYGAEEVRYTDREIAKGCNRCRRWVSKALGQLLGTDQDPADPNPRPPLIAKERKYGPRDVAGRILSLIVPFVGKKEQQKESPKGNAKAPAPAPSPTPPPAPAGPPRRPGEPPTEAEILDGQAAAAEIRKAIAAATRPAPPVAPSRAPGKLDRTAQAIADEQARKDQARARLTAQAARLRAMAGTGDRAAATELPMVEKALANLDGPDPAAGHPARE